LHCCQQILVALRSNPPQTYGFSEYVLLFRMIGSGSARLLV